MVLLQNKLNLRVSQRQILTPGLVQMVSVLALNKLELKDMINAEMVENPVLEELDGTVPLLDQVASREEERDRRDETAEDSVPIAEKKDSFEEIDFGSFFQDYLDPGYRSPESENFEKPSFEHFLSQPTTLTDHLMWQLGSTGCSPAVRAAAELVIGNLNEDGYLVASDEELLRAATQRWESAATPERTGADSSHSSSLHSSVGTASGTEHSVFLDQDQQDREQSRDSGIDASIHAAGQWESQYQGDNAAVAVAEPPAEAYAQPVAEPVQPAVEAQAAFSVADLHEAIALIRHMDPVGVACRDLRECLLSQLEYQRNLYAEQARKGQNGHDLAVYADAIVILSEQLPLVQNKQHKEIAKAINRPLEAVMQALDLLKTLDPKPGLRYNQVEPRLIEPDVAFVKQGDEYIVILNDDDVPQLRVNTSYKRLLNRDAAEKDVRNYVKERYKSAMQLIKNIEQRKQTIVKVCYAIVERQRDFLEKGIDQLKPMMIKEVAEEIGVHPSTVSRAVANKYAHTAQGVFELRYFFSESVQGPEGGNTSLLILKRRVKKLIEEEDSARPLTDEQITRILQSQGIQVTRRTVAKYREDMKIPSTHQRRVRA
jgi:RNA polymerase sigma-54 factor